MTAVILVSLFVLPIWYIMGTFFVQAFELQNPLSRFLGAILWPVALPLLGVFAVLFDRSPVQDGPWIEK